MRDFRFLPHYQIAQFLVPGITTTLVRGVVDETQHMDLEYSFLSSL